MPFVPGKRDPLFEAVRGVIVGKTDEGRYARNALGFDPLQESVRVVEIPLDERDRAMEALAGRTGVAGPPGFYYGQRAVYGGKEYRIEAIREDVPAYGSPRITLTLVDEGFTKRLRGVDASVVTVPTETTAMGEDADLLEEGRSQADVIKMVSAHVVKASHGVENEIALVDMKPADKTKFVRQLEKMTEKYITSVSQLYQAYRR